MEKAKQEELTRRVQFALWNGGVTPSEFTELIKSVVEERCGFVEGEAIWFLELAVDAIADTFCGRQGEHV